jgi:DNA-binding LacI/PurR family transcriptional regulator
VDQVSEQIEERAAELMLSVIESKGVARPKPVLLEPRLVIRESSHRV